MEVNLISKDEINNNLTGLSDSKSQRIKAIFDPMTKMLESFEDEFNELVEQEQTPEKSKKAKELKKAIAKVRINADKARKAEKEEYLIAGKAIQGVFNILKYAITDKEQKLEEIATFYERQEQMRLDKIKSDRVAQLIKYSASVDTPEIFAKMSDEIWENYLEGVKKSYKEKKEIEKKAKEEKEMADKKEAEERERIKLENEKLKAENEEKERLLKEQKKQILKEKEERDRIEAKSKAAENKHKEESEQKNTMTDKDKLICLAGYLDKRIDAFCDKEAKKVIVKSIKMLRETADKLN